MTVHVICKYKFSISNNFFHIVFYSNSNLMLWLINIRLRSCPKVTKKICKLKYSGTKYAFKI